MVTLHLRYLQCLILITNFTPLLTQRDINSFQHEEQLNQNSLRQRSGATRKSTIINDISNYGTFKFNARYNHNQVVIEGDLFDYLNGTKELKLRGIARVVLISKSFETLSIGHFHTFDNYDQFDYRNQCPPKAPDAPTDVAYGGVKLKTAQTILG